LEHDRNINHHHWKPSPTGTHIEWNGRERIQLFLDDTAWDQLKEHRLGQYLLQGGGTSDNHWLWFKWLILLIHDV
jgi:hypothetical protein